MIDPKITSYLHRAKELSQLMKTDGNSSKYWAEFSAIVEAIGSETSSLSKEDREKVLEEIVRVWELKN